MKGELVTQSQSVSVPAEENLLTVIVNAARDSSIDIEKLERLMALHERMCKEQRRSAFFAALARLQAKLGPIVKGGMNQHTRTKYARLEDVDRTIKPLLAEEGFAFSFNEESSDGTLTRFSARLSHRDGHSEEKYMTVPVDAAAKNREGRSTRSAIQDAGSTSSYARRYLIKMHLNIVEVDEDTDGNPVATISDEQEKTLISMLEEAKADRAGFLKYMEADRVSEIRAADYQKAVNALEAKIRGKK